MSALLDTPLTRQAGIAVPAADKPWTWTQFRAFAKKLTHDGVYGVGWGWIILAEVVAAEKGLGYLITVSERRAHTAAIFAVIIVIVAIGVACDRAWRLGGRLLFPYRQEP